MNRRILYNRASADVQGKPWDPSRAGIVWDGAKWVGDTPDMKPDAKPGTLDAFIMLAEGVAKLWAPDFADGPFPEHYEAAEHPVENPLHKAQSTSPVAPRRATPTRRAAAGRWQTCSPRASWTRTPSRRSTRPSWSSWRRSHERRSRNRTNLGDRRPHDGARGRPALHADRHDDLHRLQG